MQAREPKSNVEASRLTQQKEPQNQGEYQEDIMKSSLPFKTSQDDSRLYNLVMDINSIETCWNQLKIEFISSGTRSLIKNDQEIHQKLDSDLIKIESMMKDPFSKPFQGRIFLWANKLRIISDTLDEIKKCSNLSTYIEPIISSNHQALFSTEDREMYECSSKEMSSMEDFLKKNHFGGEVQTYEKIVKKSQKLSQNFDNLIKKLGKILEEVRQNFPRFYFLSNDELVELLSMNGQSESVNTFLPKVFEGIDQAIFDGKRRVLAVKSSQGQLTFLKPVVTQGRTIEAWFKDLQDEMRRSLRQAILNVLLNCPKDLLELVSKHIGQAVTTGSEIIWAGDVEKSMEKGTKGVKEYWQGMNQNWTQLIALTRKELPVNQKKTVQALIIASIHAKEVVEGLWRGEDVDKQSIKWTSQLRSYWDNDCYVRCLQTRISYDYELLGNVSKLYITPLTQRSYMSLMTAVRLNLGGAPMGPAGTGKTETVKDLAKNLGKQCVVFNCSDQMDYVMMGKFFKGIASSGAWCCFDQFNRVNIEVLSTVAQQIKHLYSQRGSGKTFTRFEGSDIKLNPNFGIFITMNPGYAGRTELPDNLKAFFRPISMTIPDKEKISEGMLNLYGVTDSHELARKTCSVFKMSSEQMSRQDHYDFGLRAIYSALKTVGKSKKMNPDRDDDIMLQRVLRDLIYPKLVNEDKPVFENIIKDLFPNTQLVSRNCPQLQKLIVAAAKEEHLQPSPQFIQKVLELNDTVQIRHTNMLNGPAGSGKTAIIRTLARALSNQPGESKVNLYTINPKVVKMDELYGSFTAESKWNDGVFSKIFRKCVEDKSNEKHWIVLDGPIDALWVQNLNVLFDDNKKLILANGQILPLNSKVTIFLEVGDVCCASPATISRCGMVFVNPQTVELDLLFENWYSLLPEQILDNMKISKKLRELKNIFVAPILSELRKSLKEQVQTINSALCQSLMKFLDSIFADYARKVSAIEESIEEIYLFACIWSLCCTTNSEGRSTLNDFVRNLLDEKLPYLQFPKKGSIYNYRYSLQEKSFVAWQKPEKAVIDSSLQYSEVVIPTEESNRSIYFLKMLIKNGKHALSCGPAGIGKSSNIHQLMSSLGDQYQNISITFSSQTQTNRVKQIIQNKLEKVNGKVFGPALGKKCVLFVDDMNMPKVQVYGARPPIELIREVLDQKGMYSQSKRQWMNIQGVTVLAAMETSRGLHPVSGRLVRHFNVMTDTELGRSTMTSIFTQLLSHFHSGNAFSASVQNAHEQLVETSLTIYEQVRTNLKISNRNPHYDFHFRDLWKVFKGLCRASASHTIWAKDVVKLWYNEHMRIYSDRLSSQQDKNYFKNLLLGSLSDFGYEKEEVLSQDRTVFGNFPLEKQPKSHAYREIKDFQELTNKIKIAQQEYNSDNDFVVKGNHQQLNLVTFEDSVEHIARIARALKQSRGHALVLGPKGVGKKSVSRLASYISGIPLFEISSEQNCDLGEWRKGLKDAMMTVGLQNKQISLLVTDTLSSNKNILEDVNDVMNGEEFFGIYHEKELEKINTTCGDFSQYAQRIKQNLHIILIMDPSQKDFAEGIRMFPSITKVCTVDWISEWPEEALSQIASERLEEQLKENQDLSATTKALKMIHQNVEENSAVQRELYGIQTLVTPASYLKLIETYQQKVDEDRKEGDSKVERIKAGIDKVQKTSRCLGQLQKQVQKVMKRQASTLEIKYEPKIQSQPPARNQRKGSQQIVNKNKMYQVNIEVDSLDREEIESQISFARTQLGKVTENIKSVKKGDLNELKCFNNPPQLCKTIFAGLVTLFEDDIKSNGGKVLYIPVSAGKKKQIDYWQMAKKHLMNDSGNLLNKIKTFDTSKVSKRTIKKLQILVFNDTTISYQKARNVSSAAAQLFLWLKGVYDYCVTEEKLKSLSKEIDQEQVEEENECPKLFQNAKIEQIKEQEQIYQEEDSEFSDVLTQFSHSVKSLKSLDKASLSQLKSFSSPPQDVVNVLAGAVILFEPILKKSGAELIYIKDRKQLDYWSYAKKSLLNDKFLQMMINFDKDSVSQKTLAKLREKLFNSPTMEVSRIAKINKAAAVLFEWIKCVYDYCTIKDRQPLKKNESPQVYEAEEQLIIKSTNPKLSGKYEVCKKMISNLSSMNRKWNQKLEQLDETRSLQGDFILTAALLTYGKGFKSEQQSQMIKEWTKILMKTGIFFSLDLNLDKIQKSISSDVSMQKLQEQLAHEAMKIFNPSLSESRNDNIQNRESLPRVLTEFEDEILLELAKATGNILEAGKLIDLLERHQEVMQNLRECKTSWSEINSQYNQQLSTYQVVASRAIILYSCLQDLSSIDPMCRYSLEWFKKFYSQTLKKITTQMISVDHLKIELTHAFKQFIEPSLFSQHRSAFIFLLTAKVIYGKDALKSDQLKFFLSVNECSIICPKNPTNWINNTEWPYFYKQLHELSSLDTFKELDVYFMSNSDKFKKLFQSNTPMKESLPSFWEQQLKTFQKILLIKVLRPESVTKVIEQWIAEVMGERFLTFSDCSICHAFELSTSRTPIILNFTSHSSTESTTEILKLAQIMRIQQDLKFISMGQGAGIRAERAINEKIESGGWVVLQDCYLNPSWFSTLETMVNKMQSLNKVNQNFRLWLTMKACNNFPMSVIQRSVKVALKPVQGVKSNLLRLYNTLTDEQLCDCSKPNEYKKLIFSLANYHSVILDRSKFGQNGWNIIYEWTDSEWKSAKQIIKILLDEYKEIPFETLAYMIGEITYRGLIRDDNDARYINALTKNYFNPEVMKDGYKFSKSGLYYSPKVGTVNQYIEYIESLPINTSPEAFGLSVSINIVRGQTALMNLTSTLIQTQRNNNFARGSQNTKKVLSVIEAIQKRMPSQWNIEEVALKYPVSYENGMNLFLQHELKAFNQMLKSLKQHIQRVKNTLKGQRSMNRDIQQQCQLLLKDRLPNRTLRAHFNSVKTIYPWLEEVENRYGFFRQWVEKGQPPAFWMNAFFRPQEFLSVVLQHHARQHKIAADSLSFEVKVLDNHKKSELLKPKKGVYVFGLYLQGVRWDSQNQTLSQQLAKQVISELPTLHLIPKEVSCLPEKVFSCPFYKVPEKKGASYATGRADNLITYLSLPSEVEQSTWIKAGAALFASWRH